MKQNRFKLWMQAVDNELLEEAQKPYRRKYTFIYRIGAMAACLVLVITAVTLTQRKNSAFGVFGAASEGRRESILLHH